MPDFDDDGKIWVRGSVSPEYGVRVGTSFFIIGKELIYFSILLYRFNHHFPYSIFYPFNSSLFVVGGEGGIDHER